MNEVNKKLEDVVKKAKDVVYPDADKLKAKGTAHIAKTKVRTPVKK